MVKNLGAAGGLPVCGEKLQPSLNPHRSDQPKNNPSKNFANSFTKRVKEFTQLCLRNR